jgi:prepilin peptidase CpaA
LFLVAIVSIAVVYDVRTRRIPNRLILCGVFGGIALSAIGGMNTVIDSLLGLGLAVGIGLVPFAMGWLGAGDVKFLGTVGALVGVALVPRTILFAGITGGLLALVSLATRRGRGFRAFAREISTDFMTLFLTQGRVLPDGMRARASKGAVTIPYGVAIGIGTLVAVYANSAPLLARR